MDIELFKLALKNINNDPDSFDMSRWYARRYNDGYPGSLATYRNISYAETVVIGSHCGTVGCLAGHILAAAGVGVNSDNKGISRAALELLYGQDSGDDVAVRMYVLFTEVGIKTPAELMERVSELFPEINLD